MSQVGRSGPATRSYQNPEAYRGGMHHKGMGAAALTTILTIGSVGVVAPTASAAPTRDLYMVKNLQSVNGLYYGDFAALRKKGRKVVGAIGAFYSEYFCIKGKVSKGKLRATQYDEFNQPAGKYTVRWKGSGSKQRIKGTTSVSKAQMKRYGGSNPVRMIKACVRAT